MDRDRETETRDSQPARRWQVLDTTLFTAARRGDAGAFDTIIEVASPRLYGFIARMVGDPDEAANLTQDVLVRLWQHLPRLHDDTSLDAWLYRVASNAALDVLRRRQRLRWLPWEGPKHDHLLVSNPLDGPEQAAERTEVCAQVQRTLASMSHRHRLALTLREYEGLGCHEIGEIMGLSRSAVTSMLFRAREEFRRLWLRAERQRAVA